METAMHLTGRYPDWWQGRRFTQAVRMWAAGPTNETTRDNPQRLLLGANRQWGTGTVPKADFDGDPVMGRGTPDLVDHVSIKHKSGGLSNLQFKSFEQGRPKWQGETLHVVWFDEEPPEDIYSEGLTRTNQTGGVTYITATPLLGMTNVVSYFYPEPSTEDRSLTQMTIEDSGLYSQEEIDRVVSAYMPHEREARAKGIPMLGSGRIFPISEDMILTEPFTIPAYYTRITGIDFGWDHPTAVAWLAYDENTDTIYVYDAYKQAQTPIAIHASAAKARGAWIPVAWPHDGYTHDKSSGEALADSYRKHGVRMLPEHATFESGGYGVEAGVQEILDRMQTGRFKVFSHLENWMAEFRTYHRDNGKIVKKHDDLMAATRYALMMLRFARVERARFSMPEVVGMDWNPLDPSSQVAMH